ncbi:MAG: hypothetical protein KAH23_02485, partial [Kiritimatiellae bacterium]|nr:hypothetical protein [Kiritimatiellia bacterium]
MKKELSRREFNKIVITGATGVALGTITDIKASVSATGKPSSVLSVSHRWLPNKESVLKTWHQITLESISDNKEKALHP